jgi:hypothetical protein
MNEPRGMGWARGIGFLTGLALATAAIIAWRIPPGNGTLGTDLLVAAVPSGEIQVSTPGPFASGTGVRPGPESNGPSGSVEVRNITGQTLPIGVKVTVSISDLDSLLWVDLEAGGRRLYRGPIGELTHGDVPTFTLKSGRSTTIDVRAWLPTSVASGFEGRIANVDLAFEPAARALPGALVGGGAER